MFSICSIIFTVYTVYIKLYKQAPKAVSMITWIGGSKSWGLKMGGPEFGGPMFDGFNLGM